MQDTTTPAAAGAIRVRDSFETQGCNRCGGCGRYSWNAMHGSTCYGCNGKGWNFTKRGLAAYNYWVALMSKPTNELQPGDKVRQAYQAKGWYTVATIAPNAGGSYDVRMVSGSAFSNWGAYSTWRVAQSNEDKLAKLQQAVAYQATLTKAGKPRKV